MLGIKLRIKQEENKNSKNINKRKKLIVKNIFQNFHWFSYLCTLKLLIAVYLSTLNFIFYWPRKQIRVLAPFLTADIKTSIVS